VGTRKAEIYRLLGVHCVELRADHGLDADGILNAERMWGPAAPPVARQQSLDELVCSACSGRALERKSRSWRLFHVASGVRCRSVVRRATYKGNVPRLHRIIADYVRALQHFATDLAWTDPLGAEQT
jgi:hypothetical protein